jgi:hypothetical protein
MTDSRHERPAAYLPDAVASVRSHRAPSRLTRRGLLGLAALTAVPAATVAVRKLRAEPLVPDATAATGGGNEVPVAASTSPEPSPTRKPTLTGGGPVPYVPGKVLLGSYLDLQGMSEAEALKLRRRQLGREQRIVHVFWAWTDTLPDHISFLPERAYPMISWRGTRHAPILDGSYDRLIKRNARQLRRFGRPVLLRWGWEMNGDWYAWSAAKNDDDASGYVKAWCRLREIFADQGADNVSWVWSPNWNNSPDVGWNKMVEYYPGDKYVDWVGVSGYNLHREPPQTLFGPIYDAYTDRKPLMITEVGAQDRGGSTKADWISRFAAWCKQNPGVGAVTWFDTDTHPGYFEKWRIDTDPESLAAYRAMARDPHFMG